MQKHKFSQQNGDEIIVMRTMIFKDSFDAILEVDVWFYFIFLPCVKRRLF